MTKQHIFIIENNLQKMEQSFFHLSRRTTMIQDLLVQRQFSLVPDNRTNVNVEAKKINKNLSLGSHSPNFSLTLYTNPKYRKGNHQELIAKRKTYNINLYRDGIHPSHTLAQNWLKRISIQIQAVEADCWQ